MFAENVYIRNTDGHTILDRLTGEIINHPQDIVIGNHVWLGYHVTVLKSVTIADGCVVGSGSLVNKSLSEPNSIYAGVPAKLIRKNIEWLRKPIYKYLAEKSN